MTTPPTDEATPVRAAPVRVLVVDPFADAAESLALLLDVYGCSVAVARSGGEAEELARRDLPDLVICELALPDADGCELAARLRAPVTAAVTGVGGEAARRRCLRAGFVCHLLKPASPDDILELLAVASFRRHAA